MLRLINTCLHRYMETVIFWVALAAAAFFGGYMGINMKYMMVLALGQASYLLVIVCLLIPISLGKDIKNGTLRNKLVAGHRRGTVFLAEMAGALIVFLLLLAAFIIPALIIGHERLSFYTARQLSDMALGLLTIGLAHCVLVVSITFMMAYRPAAAAVVCILVTLLSYSIGNTDEIKTQIMQEPGWYDYNTYIDDETGEETVNKRWVENIDYIPHDSPKYILMDVAYRSLPGFQLAEYNYFFIMDTDSEYYYQGVPQFNRDGSYNYYYSIAGYPLWEFWFGAVLTAVGWAVMRKRNMR